MSEMRKHIIRSSVLLGLFAIVGTGLLSLTNEVTKDRIKQNERMEIIRNLHRIIDPGSHDNDIFHDTITIDNPVKSRRPQTITVYRARRQGQPVAAVFSTVAPNGYNGRIKLLVGIDMNGQLTGVRAIKHKETPGLGDAIEADRSDWILGFAGKNLQNPALADWKVKKDGGVFDQFTGATITPRAVVNSIKQTLLYFENHQQEIFRRQQESATNG